ncbi:hypothetical protein [Calothrix sp. CCY 0018]|uniref:hypothetical protein n=1 Tax=Calothrix sp. CCY 0018 TaxID=3103864 RepID=UPI0039C64457
MLNFQELNPIISNEYSFVGIQKQDNELLLHLPKGFDTNNYNTYDSKRDIYFLLYKILQRYKQICAENGNLKDQLKKGRDGVIQSNHSVQKVVIPESDDDEIVLYSKLDVFGKILDAYDEPKIMSLAYRLGESEEIDYSQIHQYFDRAKFLPNGAPYIDTMDMPRLQVKYQSTDIVGMYCYILSEVKHQLDEEVTSEIQALAEEFAHRHLDTESGLFKEEYCIETVDILKDTLETIEHKTPIKDADYWDFHDAIKLFLYGDLSQQQEGEIWGISNFCYVWESMCLTYLVKITNITNLLYVDKSYLASDMVKQFESKPNFIKMANTFIINGEKLKPDAVILTNKLKLIYNQIVKLEKEAWFKIADNSVYEQIWNNYDYETSFECNFSKNSKSINPYINISYLGQGKKHHTFIEIELETKYKVEETTLYVEGNNKYPATKRKLLIQSRLPDKFYSYWKIDLEEIDEQLLSMMHQLNHVFYVAIENGIYSDDTFYQFLKNKFSIHNKNAFTQSLFCGLSFEPPNEISKWHWLSSDTKEIVAMYCQFIDRIYSFNIIDIKYKVVDYYFNKNKHEEIKYRDIRKQFVYEYLLQQHIQNNPSFNQYKIKSSFWLPTDDDSQHMNKVEQEYLNDYIELNKVSFNVVAKSYL